MNLHNKKVLVTGASGFIGSHLVERLIECGAEVTALVHYNSQNSWGWLDHLSDDNRKKIQVFFGNVTDYNSIKAAMLDINVIFHLAALISVPYSYIAPGQYIDTNVRGTYHMMYAAREAGVQRIIQTSTSEVYGTAQYTPIDENHPLRAQSPYAASKIGADKIAESFYYSYDLPVSIVRPFNTYGPRQSARAIIPTIISQVLSGVNEITLGNMDTIRDFNYIDDIVSGFISVAQSDIVIGKTINIGSGKGTRIEDVVHLITELTGKCLSIRSSKEKMRPSKSEVYQLIADNRMARNIVGWSPDYTLEEGLKRTIEWIDKEIYRYRKASI